MLPYYRQLVSSVLSAKNLREGQAQTYHSFNIHQTLRNNGDSHGPCLVWLGLLISLRGLQSTRQ